MRGHLVIADISGYTRFLTESELEHASGILEELLTSVIEAIDAPLTLSSIEGDAVFLYGAMPGTTIGQSVVESVERLYIAFSSVLETMVLNTSCQCDACVNIKNLGLKIVMHCGEFAVGNMAGRETLTGPDVILIHRLLKNHVTETTGIDDYLLVTDACVTDLGIQAIVAGWIPHQEEYELVGEINGHVASLKDVWEFHRVQNEVKVLARDAWISAQAFTPAPVGVVWDHLVDPMKRTGWIDVNDTEVQGEIGGRIGPGAEYHCAHGPDNEVAVMAIVDLKPLDYMTLTTSPLPGFVFRWTDYVIASGTGSRVISYGEPLVSLETNEPLTADQLKEWDWLQAIYQSQLDRLVEQTEKAMANSAAV